MAYAYQLGQRLYFRSGSSTRFVDDIPCDVELVFDPKPACNSTTGHTRFDHRTVSDSPNR